MDRDRLSGIVADKRSLKKWIDPATGESIPITESGVEIHKEAVLAYVKKWGTKFRLSQWEAFYVSSLEAENQRKTDEFNDVKSQAETLKEEIEHLKVFVDRQIEKKTKARAIITKNTKIGRRIMVRIWKKQLAQAEEIKKKHENSIEIKQKLLSDLLVIIEKYENKTEA